MLVVLSISNRRLRGLARLIDVQLATTAESIPNPYNHQLVCSHCIITDCQNVVCCGHWTAQCRNCTSLTPSGWALSLSVLSPCSQESSHVSTWSGQCQPRLSHELQHCTRSRAHPEMFLVASSCNDKTFPPSCGTRKIHGCVHITSTPPPLPGTDP
jgi:hypothetical protein